MKLSKARHFTNVFCHGRRFHFRALTLLVVNNNRSYPRLGIVVPKRQVRFAHQRHHIKRVVRTVFRHRQALLVGKDMIVMARTNATESAADMLERLLIMQTEKSSNREAFPDT